MRDISRIEEITEAITVNHRLVVFKKSFTLKSFILKSFLILMKQIAISQVSFKCNIGHKNCSNKKNQNIIVCPKRLCTNVKIYKCVLQI